MTIYLLDGCSADYDINKSNFSKTPPSLALEELHTDFLIWDFYYNNNYYYEEKHSLPEGSWGIASDWGGGIRGKVSLAEKLELDRSKGGLNKD